MEINKNDFIKEFINYSNEVIHAPYDNEVEYYLSIVEGDVKKISALSNELLHKKNGLGILSNDELRNLKYHFVINAAIITRYCIGGGLSSAEAFKLSDFYINKVDNLNSIEEVSNLNKLMCLDYTNRMKKLKENNYSKLINNCISYIYDHLHERIFIEQISSYLNLTPNYLSRLFKKEVGEPVCEFILKLKISTACNMLRYSELSITDISYILAFSNESYFIKIFKRYNNTTPYKYKTKKEKNQWLVGFTPTARL